MIATATPRLLLIEDDPDTALLIQETLYDHFECDNVSHCATAAEARDVNLDDFDLVLSDMNLPDGNGLELLDEFLSRRDDIPVVFVTGEGVLENAMTAIKNGAYDYIVKAGNYLFTIPLVVEKNLAIYRTKRENTELHRRLSDSLKQVQVKNRQLEDAVAQLETMAATDPLTGLANRRAFNEAIGRTFAEARRSDETLACIMVDVDGFKPFNDTFGHQRGDELLQIIAKLMKQCSRPSDVEGRFGGDEFIILLPNADERTACQVAHRVQAQFQDAVQHLADNHKIPNVRGAVTLSMGLACIDAKQVDDPDQLIARADHALYRAKSAGRNRLVIYRNTDRAVPAATYSI